MNGSCHSLLAYCHTSSFQHSRLKNDINWNFHRFVRCYLQKQPLFGLWNQLSEATLPVSHIFLSKGSHMFLMYGLQGKTSLVEKRTEICESPLLISNCQLFYAFCIQNYMCVCVAFFFVAESTDHYFFDIIKFLFLISTSQSISFFDFNIIVILDMVEAK